MHRSISVSHTPRTRAIAAISAAGAVLGVIAGSPDAHAAGLTITAHAVGNTIVATTRTAPRDTETCILGPVATGLGYQFPAGPSARPSSPGVVTIRSGPLPPWRYDVRVMCYTAHGALYSNRLLVNVIGLPTAS